MQRREEFLLGREHRNIQRCHSPAAHCPDIGEGVCRGDRAEPVGVIDNRGEKVCGQDNGGFVINFIDSRIIGVVGADQDILVGDRWQLTQNLGQVRRTEFRRSTRAA
jgi:hypothetical protein